MEIQLIVLKTVLNEELDKMCDELECLVTVDRNEDIDTYNGTLEKNMREFTESLFKTRCNKGDVTIEIKEFKDDLNYEKSLILLMKQNGMVLKSKPLYPHSGTIILTFGNTLTKVKPRVVKKKRAKIKSLNPLDQIIGNFK